MNFSDPENLIDLNSGVSPATLDWTSLARGLARCSSLVSRLPKYRPFALLVRGLLFAGMASLITAEAASADMSVNGFFPADYVRTDVFAAGSAQSTGTASFGARPASTLAATKRVSAEAVRSDIPRVRPRSGRFAKTTKGTVRSSVQMSEWDVSPVIPTKEP